MRLVTKRGCVGLRSWDEESRVNSHELGGQGARGDPPCPVSSFPALSPSSIVERDKLYRDVSAVASPSDCMFRFPFRWGCAVLLSVSLLRQGTPRRLVLNDAVR